MEELEGKLIYLAMPYSQQPGEPPGILVDRALLVSKLSGLLEQAQVANFSPITHSAVQALLVPGLPHDWEWWQRTDKIFMDRCDELWVTCAPGWKTSTGVQAEIEYFSKLGKVIRYVDYDPETLAMTVTKGEADALHIP